MTRRHIRPLKTELREGTIIAAPKTGQTIGPGDGVHVDAPAPKKTAADRARLRPATEEPTP